MSTAPDIEARTEARRAAQGDDDRRRLQGAVGRVPRHLDLEDPLPRGPALLSAAAHARRVPALQPRRRLAPAHDPAPAARRVPAAARDPPGAGAGSPETAEPERRARLRAAGAGARTSASREASSLLHASRTCSRRRSADAKLVAELEEYGVIKGELRNGRALLRRHRARDRPRGHRARALRRRRAQPARLPLLRRPRGQPAPADPRPGAALAQPAATQGGGRGAREPRRRRDAPQAPAARPRPSQDRQLAHTQAPGRRRCGGGAGASGSAASRSSPASSAGSRRALELDGTVRAAGRAGRDRARAHGAGRARPRAPGVVRRCRLGSRRRRHTDQPQRGQELPRSRAHARRDATGRCRRRRLPLEPRGGARRARRVRGGTRRRRTVRRRNEHRRGPRSAARRAGRRDLARPRAPGRDPRRRWAAR